MTIAILVGMLCCLLTLLRIKQFSKHNKTQEQSVELLLIALSAIPACVGNEFSLWGVKFLIVANTARDRTASSALIRYQLPEPFPNIGIMHWPIAFDEGCGIQAQTSEGSQEECTKHVPVR